MNLKDGFTIEEPALTVPWKISEEKLLALGGADGLRNVTRGYYTASCVALTGMSVEVGFHFEARASGRLNEFEIFRRHPKPMEESFAEFQRHLELTFGPPTMSSTGSEGLPDCEWRLPGARIYHHVFDRFGPEEHVRIQRK